MHLGKAKITELENTRDLNRKILYEEGVHKMINENENRRLNEELDNLISVNDELLKQKVKESEQKQVLLITNVKNNLDYEMKKLLEQQKEEELRAKALMEEKANFPHKIYQLKEDNSKQREMIGVLRQEIIENENAIDNFESETARLVKESISYAKENQEILEENHRMEEEIESFKEKIKELNKRIELNAVLKDVDLDELRSIAYNNTMVNTSINTIMSKFESISQKLQSFEQQ